MFSITNVFFVRMDPSTQYRIAVNLQLLSGTDNVSHSGGVVQMLGFPIFD